MATLAEAIGAAPGYKVGEITNHIAEMCWAACNGFLDWERDFVLKAAPSPDTLQKHRQDLKWLIRMVKLLHTVVSDPEFPEPSAQAGFKVLLDRLNHSWQLVHEPGMSDEEADQVLRECFPNGSGT